VSRDFELDRNVSPVQGNLFELVLIRFSHYFWATAVFVCVVCLLQWFPVLE